MLNHAQLGSYLELILKHFRRMGDGIFLAELDVDVETKPDLFVTMIYHDTI